MEKNKYVRIAVFLLLGLSCFWVGVASGMASRSTKTRTVVPQPDTKQYIDANDVKVIGFRGDGECRPFQPNDRPVSPYVNYADCDHVILQYNKVVLVPQGHAVDAEPKQ